MLLFDQHFQNRTPADDDTSVYGVKALFWGPTERYDVQNNGKSA
jgi:hypothetical protein